MSVYVFILFCYFVALSCFFYICIQVGLIIKESLDKLSAKKTQAKQVAQKISQGYQATSKVVKTGAEALNKGLHHLENGADKVNKAAADLESKTIKWADEERIRDYYRVKAELVKINQSRKEAGLQEISLVDFFDHDKELQQLAREEALAETRTQRIKKDEEEEKQKRATEVERIRAEHKQNLAQEEQLRKEKIEAEKLKEEQLKKNQTIEIELDHLETALIEFIYIRYYLTGLKTLPLLKCIYDSWAKTPYSATELNEEVWGKIIEQMSFDETKCKKIDALYHFTHKSNLPSIIQRGLMTKKALDDKDIYYKHNDEHRWDEVEDSISLSFSHPNWKMFYKYRALSGLNDWVVLKISPTLLAGVERSQSESIKNYDYLDKAIFNKFNAASFSVKNFSIEERKTHKAFLDMFESRIGKTLETYTYDNQAEVLYQGNIPTCFFDELYIFEEDDNLAWVQDFGFKLTVNKTVFEKR